MIEWTEDDKRTAAQEGWELWKHLDWPTTVHRTDDDILSETPRFASRGEVERFVAQRADEGSELHVKALAFIIQQRLLA